MPEVIKVLSGRTETVSELYSLMGEVGSAPEAWLPIFMGRTA
jgi:type IV secretion system protein VirB4